jgi:glycerol uptake facilitator-like aquaporin
MAPTIPQRLMGEALGTALLLAIVVGSGIMAERLAGGNVAIALLGNTLATVWGLYILIEVFGPVSGAHFNPAVSMVMAMRGDLTKSLLLPYIAVQLLGAAGGTWLAHLMFELPVLELSSKARTGTGQWIAEAVATAGLMLVILRAPAARVSSMVAAYIGAAYWFTASTSFANPAAAFGRMLSNTFAGISPASVPGFVIAELAGAVLGLAAWRGLEKTAWASAREKSAQDENVTAL